MQLTVLKCKLHRACVTHSELDYEGSCAIDSDLMARAGIREYEQIQIYNIANGERFTTYAIRAEAGSRTISVNGAAAHKATPGDRVIICAYAGLDEAELVGADDVAGGVQVTMKLTFEVEGGLEPARRLMEYFASHDTPMELAVSLGCAISYIQHPASMTHAPMRSEDQIAAGVVEEIDSRLAIGNFEPGSIHGYKFHDLNANGVADLDSEDLNDDGVVDVLDLLAVIAAALAVALQVLHDHRPGRGVQGGLVQGLEQGRPADQGGVHRLQDDLPAFSAFAHELFPCQRSR